MNVPTTPRKRLLEHLASAEASLDRIKARATSERRAEVHAYRGYATDAYVYVKGRVLEDRGLTSAEPTDRVLENAMNILRRFESDEIAGARVRLDVFGHDSYETTDEEGYFEFAVPLPEPLPEDRSLHTFRLALEGTPRRPDARAACDAAVITVPTGAQFGVISDVDDTVLQTGATSLVRMLTTTLLSNAHTRLPFEGVAAFYRALSYGTNSTADNPVFYVSSSPWNLYDLLAEFLDVQGIPRGPIFLRDLGLTPEHAFKSDHASHKVSAIERILSAYPHLSFVLLGDSGQHDPEIYTQVVKDFPGRIKAVYLRDVSPDERDAAVREMAAVLSADGVPVCYAPHSVDAARHALGLGLIAEAHLPDIAADTAKDSP